MDEGGQGAEVGILTDVLAWLEPKLARIAPGTVRYLNLLEIVRALLAVQADQKTLSLSYDQFRLHCKTHKPRRKVAPASFIRECSNLTTWLLAPACHRLDLPNLAIQIEPNSRNTGDPLAVITLTPIRPSKKTTLKRLNPQLDDEQWLRHAILQLDRQPGKALLGRSAVEVDNVAYGLPPKCEATEPMRFPETRPEDHNVSVTSELAAGPPPPLASVEPWEVTLVHCHLRYDPSSPSDDMVRIRRAYHDLFDAIIAEYGGYCPGGLDIVFGYHDSSFMHPHVAAQAACQLVRLAHFLSTKEQSVVCSLVIHTGRIEKASDKLRLDSIGLRTAMDPLVQHQADMGFPGQVLLTPQTHGCVADLFECHPISFETKRFGSTEQHSAYEVIQEHDQHRVYIPGSMHRVPLVGRDQELDVLIKSWQVAASGRPKTVWIGGPVGIGKSRLIGEFLTRTAIATPNLLICQGWDYRQKSAFYPLAEMLRNRLQLDRFHDIRERRKRIRRFAKEVGISREPAEGILDDLIAGAHINPLAADADNARPSIAIDETAAYCAKILDVLEPMICRAARTEPILLLAEDLHWADSYTRQLLYAFIERVRKVSHPCRLMLIVSYRGRPFIKTTRPDDLNVALSLGPLDDEASRRLVQCICRAQSVEIDDERTQETLTYAEGVPDVLHETLVGKQGRISWFKKVMAESENRSPNSRGLETKYVAQKAAILGVSFSRRELTITIDGDPQAVGLSPDLDVHLEYLLATQLLHRVGCPTQQKYRFAHDHIRDCIRQSMSRIDRERLHGIAADTLRQHIPGLAQKAPEILATHYLKAGPGRDREAIKWLHRAARNALHDSLNADAIAKLERALDLSRHAKPPLSVKTKIELLLDVARAYAAMYGSAGRMVRQSYARAERIIGRAANPLLEFRTHWGLWLVRFIHGELRRARGIATGLLRHPACRDHPICRLEAHHAMWDTLFHLGDLRTAIAYHLDGMTMMAIGPLKRQRYDYSRFAGHHAPHVCCLSRAALSLWLSGFLDQARDASLAGVQLAEDLNCVHSLAHACAYAAFTSILAREPEQAMPNAQKAVSIATESGLPQCRTMAEVLRCIAQSYAARPIGAIEPLEEAVRKWEVTGTKILNTFWRAQAAEICLAARAFQRGLQHVAVGLKMMEQTGERFYAPELYRLKGELLLADSPDASRSAEPCFHKAVEQAKQLDARLLTLRALMSLDRFLQMREGSPKKRRDALRDLKKLHQSFSQGLDTPDLRAVQVFLNQSS